MVPSDDRALDPELEQEAADAGIRLLPPGARLEFDGAQCSVRLDDEVHVFDAVYPALGSDAQSALATALGADVDEGGELMVDGHRCTSVPGVYAIGDVVSALNQISVATGHAAVAATAVHNALPRIPRGPANHGSSGAGGWIRVPRATPLAPRRPRDGSTRPPRSWARNCSTSCWRSRTSLRPDRRGGAIPDDPAHTRTRATPRRSHVRPGRHLYVYLSYCILVLQRGLREPYRRRY